MNVIGRFFLAGLISALFMSSSLAEKYEEENKKITSVTKRVWSEAVLSVTDLDRSARFFLEIAGYKERWRGEMDQGELASFGLPAEASAKVLLLGHGNHQAGMVRLVQFENAGRKEPMRPGAHSWDTGCFTSLMVRAKNLQKLYDDAIAMGWWSETPITDLEFGESRLKVVIFKGPDGVQVQSYERLAPPLPEEIGEFDSMTRPFNMMQMVDDRDTAYRFFTQVLGFDTWYHGKPYLAREPAHTPLGIPIGLTTTVPYRASMVYPKPGEFGRMEMIEIMGMEGRDHSDRCNAPNLGILAVRFPVNDIDSAVNLIEERQWPVAINRVKAKVAPYDSIEIFSVKTPDGALVSFFERD